MPYHPKPSGCRVLVSLFSSSRSGCWGSADEALSAIPSSEVSSERYVDSGRSYSARLGFSLVKTTSLSWGFFGSTAEFYPRHLHFCGQARHEVTQPLLRSTANAIDVAFLRSFTVHLTCQLVRGLLRVCYSVFLSSFEIYCFCYTTTHIRLVYQFIC